MSEIRRKLMMSLSSGHDSNSFTKVIEAIDKLPGEKSFLYKFDNSQYVYVLTMNSWSDTTQVLHVFDLEGNELASISQNSKKHSGAVINNYICMYSGTSDRSIPIDIFYFNGNSITKIQSYTGDNWTGNYLWFAYKDNSNNIHFCSFANDGRVAMWDYNINTNTYIRTESDIDAWVTWYHYDGTYFRGLIWSYTDYQKRQVAYVKRTSTTNNFDGNTFSPVLSNNYIGYFLPLFEYDGSYDKLQYEVYAAQSSNVIHKNVLGLDAIEPSKLYFGNILLPQNSTYNIRKRGGISYLDNGIFHIYSYNESTGKIGLAI